MQDHKLWYWRNNHETQWARVPKTEFFLSSAEFEFLLRSHVMSRTFIFGKPSVLHAPDSSTFFVAFSFFCTFSMSAFAYCFFWCFLKFHQCQLHVIWTNRLVALHYVNSFQYVKKWPLAIPRLFVVFGEQQRFVVRVAHRDALCLIGTQFVLRALKINETRIRTGRAGTLTQNLAVFRRCAAFYRSSWILSASFHAL